MYVNELKVEYRRRRVIRTALLANRLEGPAHAAALLASIIGREAVEVFGAVLLNVRQGVIAYHEISRGTLDATPVCPRDVLRAALLSNAGSVLVGHNHPSGDPSPSAEDVALTERLAAAARVMGIDVADHVIVAPGGGYFSFRQAGRL